MDLIEMARELGKELQKDERFERLQKAQMASDADTDLQQMIGEFNLKRMSITNEASKPDRDEEKLQQLNAELREMYDTVMKNERMDAFNTAKQDMDALLHQITTVIIRSAEGHAPDSIDVDAESCVGDCSSCGGCH